MPRQCLVNPGYLRRRRHAPQRTTIYEKDTERHRYFDFAQYNFSQEFIRVRPRSSASIFRGVHMCGGAPR